MASLGWAIAGLMVCIYQTTSQQLQMVVWPTPRLTTSLVRPATHTIRLGRDFVVIRILDASAFRRFSNS